MSRLAGRVPEAAGRVCKVLDLTACPVVLPQRSPAAPSTAEVVAFQAAALQHFEALTRLHGVSGEAAAALALRLAGAVVPPAVRPEAHLLAATQAHRAAVALATSSGDASVAGATREAFVAAATAALDLDALAVSFLIPRPLAAVVETDLSLGEKAVSRVSLNLGEAHAALSEVTSLCDTDTLAARRVHEQLAKSTRRLNRLAHGKEGGAGDEAAIHGVVLRCGLLLLLGIGKGFSDSGGSHKALYDLLCALAALPDSCARVGSLVVSQLPVWCFTEVLETLHEYFIARFYEHLGNGTLLHKHLWPCACVMAWLHAANAEEGGRLASSAAFHNDALNSEDWVHPPPGHSGHSYLSDDYNSWVAMQRGAGEAPLTVAAARKGLGWRGRGSQVATRPLSFCAFPFLYRPESKAEILRLECEKRKQAEFQSGMLRSLLDAQACPFCIVRVRRSHIVSDAAREILRRRGELRKPLKVVFIGEEGVDEGGPTREFFTLVTRAIFSPDYGMFAPPDQHHHHSQQQRLWFVPCGCEAVGEEEYELTGTVLGLALYNSTLLELAFPGVVYKLLQGRVPTFDDLADVSPRMHASLSQLLAAPPEEVEATFGLTFEISFSVLGTMRTAELVPQGASVAVSGDNVRQFVALYADWLLSASVAAECAAFRRGFARVCDGPASRLFTAQELEQMLCGTEDLDFAALEGNAEYDGGFTPHCPVCRHFWAVAHAMTPPQKKRLLSFVTGSDRVPIGGLAALPFKLMRNGDGDERLPTAQTCFHVLLLPAYSTQEVLQARLLLALDNSEGFGLR